MSTPWSHLSADLDDAFAPLRAFPRLLLAVSGGSDSTALLHLVARWARALSSPAPSLSVATVDHGLRPQSRVEAEQTVAAAEALGLETAILTWEGEKPAQGLQEAARDMRYALLGAHALRTGSTPCAIVTAHTCEDQAETVLMRLARGSGPDGLQGMQTVRTLGGYPDVFLARPLLAFSREQLRDFLREIGVSWIDDPSNENAQFERVRVRAAAPHLQTIGITPEKIALTARRQQRAVSALEIMTDRLANRALGLNGGAFASIDAEPYLAAPSELQVRLLGRVLTIFGGASEPAELAQVERLAQRVAAGPTRMTLGGCEIRACSRIICVFRERGRAELAPWDLEPGSDRTWDQRFQIRSKADATPVTVRAVDRMALSILRRCSSRRLTIPARAAATLPAVWAGDDLVAVGALPFRPQDDAVRHIASLVDVRFLFGHTVAQAY